MRFRALLTAVVLVAGVTACNNEEESATTSTVATAPSTTAAPSTTGEEVDEGEVEEAETVLQLRRAGTDGFEPAWTEATSTGSYPGMLLAVSADEAWFTGMVDTTWSRFSDGAVEPAFASSVPGEWTDAAVSSDGAVWVAHDPGLTLVGGDGSQTEISTNAHGPVAAGTEGEVWAIQAVDAAGETEQHVVGYWADGTRKDLGVAPVRFSEVLSMAAADGVVWAMSGGYIPPSLARWDDGWERVRLPGRGWGLMDPVVASDGALWAIGCRDESGDEMYDACSMVRYANGEWTTFDLAADVGVRLLEAGDDVFCATAVDGVECFDANGPTASPLPPGIEQELAEYAAVERSPDGTYWSLSSVPSGR